MNLLSMVLLATFQADARLAVHADLIQPRLTYAELGAWVQKKTGVAIYVSPSIRERKATVLVEDRPVRETMDRVAEALFLEWEPTKEGYTLRLPPKVAAEEARMASNEEAAWMLGLHDALDTMAGMSGKTPEQLKAAYDDAKAEYDRLSKDPSPEGKRRLADETIRLSRLGWIAFNKQAQGAGKILAKLSPSQRESIFRGSTIYASDQPNAQMLPLTTEAMDLIGSGMTFAESQLKFFTVRLTPGRQLSLTLAARSDHSYTGSSMNISGSDLPSYRQALADEPLRKRLLEWTTMDPKVNEAKLAQKDQPEPPALRKTPYIALAELLVKLHARTGLPIVADGFRLAMVSRQLPEGPDVATWIRSLRRWSDGRYRGYSLIARGSEGWLMLRHSQYWKQLPREVPEGRIRTLEAAAGRKEGATLEEYAAFAGGLTDAQVPWVDGENLVMDAPYTPLSGNVSFLRLWNALPTTDRRIAQSPQGLLASSTSAVQQRLYLTCLADKMADAYATNDALPYALPGGPALPSNLRLFVRADPRVFVTEFREFVVGDTGRTWDSNRDVVPGYQASLGLPGIGFANFSIPLHRAPQLPAQ